MPYTATLRQRSTLSVQSRARSEGIPHSQGSAVYYSEYFRKALNGPWKEATERIVNLENVEPVIDRPILQLLVDEHCDEWHQCCTGDDADAVRRLPCDFLVRAIRWLSEEQFRQLRKCAEKKTRCYYEHMEEGQRVYPRAHTEYDKEKDFGFFGKRVKYGGFREDDDDPGS
ncbi:hypothetical protein EJ02DRAFT_513298 [Clathrospora elynae]|uniref:Uncharacterized protein n=1 Tax=Clathrospora elynae TaxID=706981 RepID=A0A6A5SHR0_9PLEO|nr:hypothetical protein EJ02DRAFT_513298 [Clathrospora elynae]